MHTSFLNSILVVVLLAVMTLGVYHSTGWCEFIELDDNEYVTENPMVQAGLTRQGLMWAWTSFHSANWHPITWISHMADCQIWGTKPAGHHLTNVLLHVTNVLLIFWFFLRTTGDSWRSGFAAALFAVHPIHVESVTWISERKDVLSGCFWILTMIAYRAYVEDPKPIRYLGVLLPFVLGLMAKPMLVTLPLVLLLLDEWPFRRSLNWASRVVEKIPLLFLSAASCVITVMAQQESGAIASVQRVSLWTRVANASVAYTQYLFKTFWPCDLIVYYPLRHLHPLQIITAWLVLAAVSAGVLFLRRKRPYLAVGWLWFLGTLVPVIGLVQVGGQAMADRYLYIPLLGILIMLVWSLPAGSASRLTIVPVIVVLMALASVQVGYWRDSVSLFRHALAHGGSAPLIHYNLGVALAKQGRNDEAIVEYREALRLFPDYVEAYNNLGDALYATGHTNEAIEQYRDAIRLNPELAAPHGGLGVALAVQGRIEEAIPYLQKAVAFDPENVEYRYNFASALAAMGRYAEAAVQYRHVLSCVDSATQPHLAEKIRKQIEFSEQRFP